MKLKAITSAVLILLCFALTACGGGGGGGSSSSCTLNVTPTGTISLLANQGQTFNITSSCSDLAASFNASFSGFIGNTTESTSCTNGSCSYTFSNDTAFQTGTITFTADGASPVTVTVQITT